MVAFNDGGDATTDSLAATKNHDQQKGNTTNVARQTHTTITQTNTNMFYINRNSVEANGKVSVSIDQCHSKDAKDDFSRSVIE